MYKSGILGLNMYKSGILGPNKGRYGPKYRANIGQISGKYSLSTG